MNSEARKRAQEQAAPAVEPVVAVGVEVFRSAWLDADARGWRGHRVEAGIRALLAAGWTPPGAPWLPILLAWLDTDDPGPLDFQGNPIPPRLADLLQRAFGLDAEPAPCRCVMVRSQTHIEPAEWEQADDCPVHPVKAVEVQPCPECRAGKHPNCDGSSWDFVVDEPAPCPCSAAGHQDGGPC